MNPNARTTQRSRVARDLTDPRLPAGAGRDEQLEIVAVVQQRHRSGDDLVEVQGPLAGAAHQDGRSIRRQAEHAARLLDERVRYGCHGHDGGAHRVAVRSVRALERSAADVASKVVATTRAHRAATRFDGPRHAVLLHQHERSVSVAAPRSPPARSRSPRADDDVGARDLRRHRRAADRASCAARTERSETRVCADARCSPVNG